MCVLREQDDYLSFPYFSLLFLESREKFGDMTYFRRQQLIAWVGKNCKLFGLLTFLSPSPPHW